MTRRSSDLSSHSVLMMEAHGEGQKQQAHLQRQMTDSQKLTNQLGFAMITSQHASVNSMMSMISNNAANDTDRDEAQDQIQSIQQLCKESRRRAAIYNEQLEATLETIEEYGSASEGIAEENTGYSIRILEVLGQSNQTVGGPNAKDDGRNGNTAAIFHN